MNNPARQHDGRQRHVRATVHHDLDVLCQESTIGSHACAVAHQRWMALRRGSHVFAAVVHDLHRLAALQRQQRGVQRDGRGVLLLPAEPAAGRGLDHAHAPLVPAEGVTQRFQDVVGTLHRAAHDEHASLERRDHPLRLEIDVLLRAGLVDPFDHDRRAGEGTLHVALPDVEALEDVVGAVLDLVGPRRDAEIRDRGLGGDIDLHRRRRAPQRGAIGVRQQHHRLVDVAHVSGGEHRLIRFD